MSRYRWALGRFYTPMLLLLLALAAGAGCGPSETPPSPEPQESTPSLTQADGDQGGVAFQATIVAPQGMAELGHPPDHLGFLVSLDTHSGSLLGYDLAALSALRDDGGRVAQALGWEPESEDSHHRSGLLYFDGLAPSSTGGQHVELVLRNVGGVPERSLRWPLPLPAFKGSPGDT